MRRLNHPVYRNRVLQVAADAALVALAFYLAFRLRFLDDRSGLPHRYEVLFAQSVGFVVVGKLDRLRRLRALPEVVALRQRPRLPADRPRRRRRQRDPGRRLHRRCSPSPTRLPRSVAVMDFLLTLMLIAGARLAVRLIVERPSRGDRVPKHEVLVVGAGSGGQMVVRELQLNPNLGATAIGFVDDDPRKRGMRMLGLKVLGSTERDRRRSSTRPSPTRS